MSTVSGVIVWIEIQLQSSCRTVYMYYTIENDNKNSQCAVTFRLWQYIEAQFTVLILIV